MARSLERPHLAALLRAVLVAPLLASAAFAGGGGGVRYVDHNAEPGGDGLAWGTAHRWLQDALGEAQGGGIEEIRVAQGTYRPDRGSGQVPGDRTATFRLVSNVAVRGGYQGLGGADPDARDIATYETILSGDLLGDDEPAFVNATENAYQVVTALEVEAATLDGLTVCGGYADGEHFGASPDSREQGSGVNIYFATPTLVDCTFRNNWAFNHGAVNDHGDAIVLRCVFEGNYSETLGAALYLHHHADTVVTECTFRGNRTAGNGGGLYCRSQTAATVTDCVFEDNEASHGGGLYIAEDSTVVVRGCVFTGNRASERGGGAYNHHSVSLIEDCVFTANEVYDGAGGGGGGGIWNESGSPTVRGCTFSSNTAIERGGGVYSGAHSTARILDCEFFGNVASEDGGGMSNAESDTLVVGCTFEGNVARDGVLNVGGGMSNYLSAPIVADCVFRENRVEVGPNQGGGGGMYNEAGCPTIINCAFIDNVVDGEFFAAGGGMYSFQEACPRVHGCLFVGNRVLGDGYIIGGGMYNDFMSDAVISNCTFSDNTAALWGGGLISFFSAPTVTNTILWGNTPDEILDDGGSASELRHCDVQGGWTGAGSDNFAIDPAFVDAIGRDFRLSASSPCIDRGHNWAVPADITDADGDGDVQELGALDLAGAMRFADDPGVADLGCGAGALVDLGPYEAQYGPAMAQHLGDINGDGAVDFGDFVAVLAAWGPCVTDCCLADLDLDGQVAFTDLLSVLANWS